MKRSNCLIFAILAIILAAAAASFAQSTDRDNPTPLSSGEISGSFIDHQRDHGKENFYSFIAGPGELTIVFDVKRQSQGDMATINFELLERNGSIALICCEYAQSGDGGSGRETARVKLTRLQTVVLHITNASVGGGTFHIHIGGAASFGGTTIGGGYGDANDDDHANRGGDQITVPASGTLHIRMKNGTTQDIDLGLVRNVSVRP